MRRRRVGTASECDPQILPMRLPTIPVGRRPPLASAPATARFGDGVSPSRFEDMRDAVHLQMLGEPQASSSWRRLAERNDVARIAMIAQNENDAMLDD